MQFIILDACTDLRDEGPFRAIHNPGGLLLVQI